MTGISQDFDISSRLQYSLQQFVNYLSALIATRPTAQSNRFDEKRHAPALFRHGNIREITVDPASKSHVAKDYQLDTRG